MADDFELFAADELSVQEKDERELHESIVDNSIAGIQQIAQIGDASLKVLRDKRLYRSTHKTFEDYCQERFGITRIQAHRRIAFGQLIDDLLPRGNKNLPATERQARPLTKLDTPEQQADAWEAAQAATGKEQPPASAVADAVQELQAKLANSERAKEEWRQQWKDERDAKRQLEADLRISRSAERTITVEVPPADYEHIKASLARANKDLAEVNAQIGIAANAQAKEILKSRQNELDTLEARKRQLEKTIKDHQAEIADVNAAALEMRRQREEIEKAQQALAVLAAAMTMFEYEADDPVRSAWLRLSDNLFDAAEAAKVFSTGTRNKGAA